jgi:hypothetical protein
MTDKQLTRISSRCLIGLGVIWVGCIAYRMHSPPIPTGREIDQEILMRGVREGLKTPP